MGRGIRSTVTYVCRNRPTYYTGDDRKPLGGCADAGKRYDVATIKDQTGCYIDGETACPTCGKEGEELD